MTKSFAALVAVACLALAAPAYAQFQPRTAPAESGRVFVDVNGAGQLQTRGFASSATFSSFGEPGRFDAIQNIGRGGGFDLTGGYEVTKHVRVGVGVWMTSMNSAAAGSAAMPDPLVFGRYKTVTLSGSDLKQTNVGANIQLMWTTPIANRTYVSLFLGPTIVRVRQDVAAVSVTPNSQTATFVTATQSATTARAGNAGLDLSYRFTDRMGIGAFARYAGGEATLPAAPKLKVGGFQIGGGVRLRF